MDRFTTEVRTQTLGVARTGYLYRIVDRLGRSGWKNKASSRLYHTFIEAGRRQKALNAGHLRAWIEKNRPEVWALYEIQRKPRLNRPVEHPLSPYLHPEVKDRRREFGMWLRRNRPGLITRFKADTERRIKEYEAK